MYLFEGAHESVRKYYHKLKYILKEPRKRERRFIAVDETVIRVGDQKVFVWAAIDVETKKCLAVWVPMASHQFIASKFIKMVLKYKNKPTFIVDRVWYKNFKELASIMKLFFPVNQEQKDSTTDSQKIR